MLHITTSPSLSLPTLTLLAFSSILSLQASTATAKTNDWSVPCFQGRCAYDLVQTANSGDKPTSTGGGANGSLQIWGSTTGISDITSSAGWIILSCNSSAASSTTSNQTQVDVRLVCSSEDTSATGCDHLFANGAEGTLVRMPPQDSQNCTSAPFLRVAKAWVPEDQTISTSVKRSIIGRGDNSTVHALTLDTNFAAMDASKHGNVSFSIQAGSVYSPNTGSTAASSTVSSRRRGYHHSRRSMAAESRRRHEFVADSLARRGFFGAHTTSLESTPTSIAVSNSLATLISADVPCSASVASPTFSAGPVSVQAGVEASVDVNLDAQIQVGIVAAGSLIPPKITELGLTADFNASIDGKLNLEANVTGTIDSGTISLFQVGIPGLSFPGILTIGPSFAINAEAKATLEIDVDLTIDLAHNITNGHMVFPPGAASADQATNNGQFVPSNTGLTFAANPELNGTASVEAHLIPTLEIGITAFEGIASANIFLDLDASAKLGLNGTTSASVTGTANSTDVSTTAPQGCVDVSAQLSVNAGADAKFFSIFDETVQVPLFDKTFDIFQKCFDAASSGASSTSATASSTAVVSSLASSTSDSATLSGSYSSDIQSISSTASSSASTASSSTYIASSSSDIPSSSDIQSLSPTDSVAAIMASAIASGIDGTASSSSQSDASMLTTSSLVTSSVVASATPSATSISAPTNSSTVMARRLQANSFAGSLTRRTADLQCGGTSLSSVVGLISQIVTAADIAAKVL